MTNLKVDRLATIDYWRNEKRSYCTDEEVDAVIKAVNTFPWPGKRAPRIHKICVFAWDDWDVIEIQVSCHRGCWKKAVYRVSPGETVLVCKDWKGEQLGAVCPF